MAVNYRMVSAPVTLLANEDDLLIAHNISLPELNAFLTGKGTLPIMSAILATKKSLGR